MHQQTVLIADDDAQFRKALRARLSARGLAVVECWDGVGVLTKCQHTQVDALILDQEMPTGEGRCIAQLVRAFSGAPIIFVSGHAKEDFRDAVMSLPDTYYLAKPLGDGQLESLLNSLMASRTCPCC